MKGGHKVNPCEKYPYHMTRHWYGEDGAHIWSSHTISGAEGAWAGDISCVGEYFQPKGPILKGLIRGQYPSHWVATKRSDREVDVHGLVTLMVEGGGTYTAHVHEYIKFWEPCVTINRLREATERSMFTDWSLLWLRVAALTPPTSMSTSSSGSHASPSTATSGNLSTSRPSIIPTTGTTKS